MSNGKAESIRRRPGGDPEVKEAHFGDKTTIKLSDDDVNKMYDDVSEKILESLAKYRKEGSGWRLKIVVKLEIHTTEYNPVGRTSYIPSPEKLRGKKAVRTTNVSNGQ